MTVVRPTPVRRGRLPNPLQAEQVAAIVDLIVSGDLPLGQKISEQEVADVLAENGRVTTSRTSVRPALAILSALGFALQRPQVGCWFPPVEEAEIDEILSLRGGLEGLVVKRLADRRDSTASEELEEAESRLRDAVDKLDVDGVLVADTDFHAELAVRAGLGTGANSIRTWGDKLRIFCVGRREHLSETVLQKALHAHGAIFSLVAAGAAPEAVVATERHLTELHCGEVVQPSEQIRPRSQRAPVPVEGVDLTPSPEAESATQ